MFGGVGRRALEERLPGLRDELGIDFCIVNGENAADGRGITPKLADKIHIGGAFWLEPRGERKVERVCTIDIDVKIFGVGKVVEAFVEKSTRESYDRAATFTNKYIAEKGL